MSIPKNRAEAQAAHQKGGMWTVLMIIGGIITFVAICMAMGGGEFAMWTALVGIGLGVAGWIGKWLS